MRGPALNLKPAILDRMTEGASDIWTAVDFVDLGPRGAVDLALHRLVASKDIRRIARGLYDKPATNQLTGKPTYPDYRKVVDARSRSGCRPSCVISFAGPMARGNLKANPKQPSPERIPRARMVGSQIISMMTMTTNTTIIMINSRINESIPR